MFHYTTRPPSRQNSVSLLDSRCGESDRVLLPCSSRLNDNPGATSHLSLMEIFMVLWNIPNCWTVRGRGKNSVMLGKVNAVTRRFSTLSLHDSLLCFKSTILCAPAKCLMAFLCTFPPNHRSIE